MIKNYDTRRPQSFVYQNKEIVEDAVLENDNAFIFGPAIYNSTLENDAANINVINSTATTTKLLFKGIPENGVEVVKSGKVVAYDTSSEDVITRHYIPNTDLWQKLTEGNDWVVTAVNAYGLTSSGEKVGAAIKCTISNWDSALVEITLPSTPEEGAVSICVEQNAYKAFNEDTEITKIGSATDIRDNFGPITLDNPVAFGCSLALASAGKAIFADTTGKMPVSGDVASGGNYANVLSKIELTDKVQFLCPVFGTFTQLQNSGTGSSNAATINGLAEKVRSLALAHVEAMSNESKKRWRRCYFGSQYTTGAYDFSKNTKYTTSEVTDLVVGQAIASNSDRFILVWTDDAQFLSEEGLQNLENDYIACCVAGLRSSKLPQQGLSRQTIKAVSAAPKMYTKWSETKLDKIAEQGVFIITQDYKNTDIYIRHQLTTDTSDGLLYWEDSVGVNVDEISYMARELVEPYIGKRNATPQTLTEINNKWYAALLERTNSNNEDPAIGPQIVEIVDGSVKTYVDPNLKDRIIMTATVVIALPINTIVVYINATASI